MLPQQEDQNKHEVLGWSDGWDEDQETVLLQPLGTPDISPNCLGPVNPSVKGAFITKGPYVAQATFCLHKTESIKWSQCSQRHSEDFLYVKVVLL